MKALLMILDGWGISPDPSVSAIDQANTPFMDSLYGEYPHSTLRTDGMEVGLPNGQMGNSEVGHVNLGAGRVVYQDLAKINMAVEKDTLKDESVLQEAFKTAKENKVKLHFLGLVSDGGVHAHINHIKELVRAAKLAEVPDVFVHAFTDGRDVDPKSGAAFIEELQESCAANNAQVASVVGRYYAMDRDKRWERVKKAYDLLVHGKGKTTTDFVAAIKDSYADGTTDEFIEPLVRVGADNQPLTTIQSGDVVVFFNFRTDRGRQLTQALNQQDFEDYDMKKQALHLVTLTNYDDSFEGVQVVFDKDNVTNSLGEVLAKAGKKQIRIAETEKYPHVTFFFSGGREEPFEGEERILCPSPKVATYDLQPEMSAYELRDAIVPKLRNQETDFVCLNFANPDMVGHTGSMEATIKACETVDGCAKDVVEAAKAGGFSVLIIADHGNCDTMVNADGSPNTAHTTNPVPIILIDDKHKSIKNGNLGNIAPTILDLMGVEKPAEMTANSLL
jgi:2,3-bisphosphoglycerate-independent phosphoglycerate mutase